VERAAWGEEIKKGERRFISIDLLLGLQLARVNLCRSFGQRLALVWRHWRAQWREREGPIGHFEWIWAREFAKWSSKSASPETVCLSLALPLLLLLLSSSPTCPIAQPFELRAASFEAANYKLRAQLEGRRRQSVTVLQIEREQLLFDGPPDGRCDIIERARRRPSGVCSELETASNAIQRPLCGQTSSRPKGASSRASAASELATEGGWLMQIGRP